MAALVGLMAASQLVGPSRDVFQLAEMPLVATSTAPDAERVALMHRADPLLEVLNWLEDILDALQGRKRPTEPEPDNPDPTPPDPENPDPENPDPEEVTEEEIEDINEAAEDAEDQGVDLAGERVDETWTLGEVVEFLGLLIELIEDYQQAGE